jgi:hypothetical protein
VDIGERLSAAQLRSTILNGMGRMPGFPALPSNQIAAIISYVRDGVESTVPIPADAKPVPWDSQYRFTGFNKFLDIDGYPAIAPPWGTLNAINMNTGEYAWTIPLGEYPELAAKGIKNTGSENYGGPIVTAGGLVFIAATLYDNKFRAFDKATGKLVWETTLPFAGDATPATYEINGRQYIVVATSSGRRSVTRVQPKLAGATLHSRSLPVRSNSYRCRCRDRLLYCGAHLLHFGLSLVVATTRWRDGLGNLPRQQLRSNSVLALVGRSPSRQTAGTKGGSWMRRAVLASYRSDWRVDVPQRTLWEF